MEIKQFINEARERNNASNVEDAAFLLRLSQDHIACACTPDNSEPCTSCKCGYAATALLAANADKDLDKALRALEVLSEAIGDIRVGGDIIEHNKEWYMPIKGLQNRFKEALTECQKIVGEV
jgi:hypothetical protein